MDECRHDECCMRSCNKLCPNFLQGWKPKTTFDENALRNIKWVYYNGARYWKGYNSAYTRHSWPIIFASFRSEMGLLQWGKVLEGLQSRLHSAFLADNFCFL